MVVLGKNDKIMMNKNKKDFFDAATVNILNQINDFGLSEKNKKKAVFFTKLFRETFKYDEIKKYLFVTPESKIWDLGYDSAGFCRVASIAFSIVMGIQDWQLMCINNNQWYGNASHHYLKHLSSGKFFDLTYDQFAIDGYIVPYELGHSTGFNFYPGDMSQKFIDILNVSDILRKQFKEK